MVGNRLFGKSVEFACLRVSFDGRIKAIGSKGTKPYTQTRYDAAKGHLRPFLLPATALR